MGIYEGIIIDNFCDVINDLSQKYNIYVTDMGCIFEIVQIIFFDL